MRNRLRTNFWLAPVLAAASLLHTPLYAQDVPKDYPNRPIEWIIPAAPGGGIDLFGRTVTRVLSEQGIVTQSFQITNKPGAGGAIGMAEMVQRKGDINTLLGVALHVHLTPLLQGTPHSYKDMTPIAKLFAEYAMMVVRKDSPIKSLDDVVEAIKKDPGSIKFGGSTIGNTDHLTAANLAKVSGVDPRKITFVPYTGGESNAAILGGHVDVGMGGPDLIDLVTGGEMRVLGVASPERLSGPFAELPTFKEQGYEVVTETWRGVFGPPAMPAAGVKYWQDALGKMVKTDAWRTELTKNQWVDRFETESFPATLDREHEEFRKSLIELGLVAK
ncbi:Bug family tripartite tricarboxylate transporter substrate binding protein [Agaricicola taiwanensis]|uniref:Bug family tripartite tricarboxylate transporter substrate binding protein n=1 Tax=Agaricicola taiwanensis TaxID=591372 RepID=UPI00166D0175|nr:tripartite tricarboxylate transporter substrate binding protein [Agaricicola taiwanensis]